MKPPVSGKELLTIVKKLGFEVIRKKGSHHFVQKEKTTTIIPIHNNRALGEGLVLKILKDIDLSKKEFQKLRKKN